MWSLILILITWGLWHHHSLRLTFPPKTFERIFIILLNSIGKSGGIGAMLSNPTAATIQKEWTFKILRRMQTLQKSSWDHQTLYSDWPWKAKQFLERQFLQKNYKYERGRLLNFEIHVLFYGDNSWTLAIRQMQFGAGKDQGYTYKNNLNHYFDD
jgi:hypothetical protein